MPYKNANDAKLPSNVKKLSFKKRKTWVSVFNATLSKCETDGGDDCEGLAFRTANGAVKSERAPNVGDRADLCVDRNVTPESIMLRKMPWLFAPVKMSDYRSIAMDEQEPVFLPSSDALTYKMPWLFAPKFAPILEGAPKMFVPDNLGFVIEGGPGSGNAGHKSAKGQRGGSLGGTGGGLSKKVRLSRHAQQRTRERRKYQSVKKTMASLQGKTMPEKDWFVSMSRKGKVDGFLVGIDGIVKTVLGSWGKPRGQQIVLEAESMQRDRALIEGVADTISLTRSIKWQFDNMTRAIATKYCEISGIDNMTPTKLALWFEDYDWPGLEGLLMARSEVLDRAPAGERRTRPSQEENAMKEKKADELVEAVFGTQSWKARVVAKSFMSTFGTIDSEGYYHGPHVSDIFFDDDKFGDAVISYDYKTGETYATPFEMTSATEVKWDSENKREVVLVYEYLDVVAPGAIEETVVQGEEVAAKNDDDAQNDDDVSEQPINLPEKFNESESVRVLTAETDNGKGNRDPITITARLIKAGPGNKRDMHYYPGDMLRRDAHIFEGTEMWITDHDEADRTEASKVSVIDRIVSYEDDGSPIAEITVFDPDFAEKVRNRAKAQRLHTLNCSILATGFAEKAEIDDVEYNVVTSLDESIAVDWVSRPGAGGEAQSVVSESDAPVVDDEDEEVVTTSESTPVTISEDDSNAVSESDDVLLDESTESIVDVKTILSESNLPPLAQAKLATQTYATRDALAYAIAAEQTYLKALTGSGTPVSEGTRTMSDQPPNSFFGEIPITENDDEWWKTVRQEMHLPA